MLSSGGGEGLLCVGGEGEEDGVKGECHDVTVEGAARAVLKTDLLAIPSGGM